MSVKYFWFLTLSGVQMWALKQMRQCWQISNQPQNIWCCVLQYARCDCFRTLNKTSPALAPNVQHYHEEHTKLNTYTWQAVDSVVFFLASSRQPHFFFRLAVDLRNHQLIFICTERICQSFHKNKTENTIYNIFLKIYRNLCKIQEQPQLLSTISIIWAAILFLF